MRGKMFTLLTASLFAAMLSGCGSSRDSGGDQTSPGSTLTNAQSVGTDSCKVCHTAILAEGWNNSAHDISAAGCEGCHGGGQYHKGVGPIPYPSPDLEQCAQCHSVNKHADNAETPEIEGYVVTECQACHSGKDLVNTTQWAHNPAATTINEQWANSAHAGHVATGPVTDETGPAWAHYNWDDNASRGSCQRCHTATGASNFLSGPTTYNAANNTFSHLADWSATGGSAQNELLYCWGCHSDVATGALRNPGAISEAYAGSPSGSPSVTVNYPDAFASNVCMGCHLGREVGGVIAASTGDFSNMSFINSHYLAAGGMVFSEAGYEFAGQDYSGWSKHATAGNTDGNGPCVTCHMTSAEPHTFKVVEKDGNGVITAVATNACDTCHGNMNATWLEERKESFHEGLDALKQALEAKGIYFWPSYPYFYKVKITAENAATEAKSANAFKNWDSVYPGFGKDVMGAAFNYNLIEHDPGAFAHNSAYALKLIAHSIDFLADGVVDGVGNFTINAESIDLLNPAAKVLGYTLDEKHNGGAALVQASYKVDTTVYDVGCGDCHASGSKTSNGLIIDQFAESAHGDVFGEAWMHYDWRASNRASCQRCHTATGFVTKLGNESDTTNVFAAGDVNLPGETLRCTGCHTDIATGAVRAAAAYTATYSNGATQVFPDVGASNLCVRCHGARESGDSVKLSAADFSNVSFINSHYLAAGATVFAGGGYEFAGGIYANPAFFKHDVVGIATPGAPTAADSGPCIGCHMGTSANHTWEVVAKNEEGVITAISSETCISCHAGNYALTPEKLELEKEELHAALGALEAAMAAKGIHFYAAHPYFYTAPYVAGGTNTAFKNWSSVYPNGKDVMGAAFNYNLLEHDPGAYAHNRFYTKRLIFDSIDFLDNGALDGAINVTGDAATYLDGDSSTAGIQRP